jgi:hypothetical protein
MSYLIMLGNYPDIMFPMYKNNKFVVLFFLSYALIGNVLLFNFL